jgi:copper chaperone
MTTLKVDGMHCNMCVARINKALDAAKIAHEVKLEDKTVTIANDGEREKAVQALDDIGFEAK